MSPKRAQEIWDARSPFGEFSMTDAEKAEVKKVWFTSMPGHTCFASGEVVADESVMIG